MAFEKIKQLGYNGEEFYPKKYEEKTLRCWECKNKIWDGDNYYMAYGEEYTYILCEECHKELPEWPVEEEWYI